MASIGALIIDLVARTGSFETDLGRAARAADRRAREIDRSIGRLGSRIAAGFAGLAAGISFAAIIEETSKAEAALAKLDNAVRNNAGAAGQTTQGLVDLSGELQKLTTYGDDAIQEMQALLLSFRQLGGPEFERAQTSVLDVATALGQDLNSAARLVGRALADPERGMTALARAGVVLSEDQKKVVKALTDSGRLVEAQGVLLGELESRFGGAARAARDTFGGAIAGLRNAFGDLLEVKSGLPGAVDSLNELTSLLQDPATVAAVDTLTSSLIRGFTAAFRTVTEFVGGIKVLSEDLAAIQFGAAADDLVRLNEQLALAQELRAAGPSSLVDSGQFLDRLRFFGKDGFVEWYSDEELDAEITRLRKQIDDRMQGTTAGVLPPATQGAAGAAPTIELPPSEEFTKLADRLREQIALYGKVGEAAKISYALQVGALEDVSTAEGQQLLALARRLDAVVEQAAAEKEATATRERAQESLEQMNAQLEQQVATFGRSAEETIRYRITQGDLAETFADAGAAADPLRQSIIQLTGEYERLSEEAKAAEEAVREQSEIEREIAGIYESTRTPLERYNDEVERLQQLRAENPDLLDDDTFGRAIEQAEKKLQEATDNTKTFFDEAKRNAQDILGQGIYDVVKNGFDQGADAAFDSFKDMLIRMAAEAVAADLMGKIFGTGQTSTSGGGGNTGWLASLAQFAAGFFGGGRAIGGPVSAGTMYRINEREPEFFRPRVGGNVIPLSKMPGMMGEPMIVNNNISIPSGGGPSGIALETRQQLLTTLSAAMDSARRRNR